MGVDVTTGPVTNLDQADHQNNSLVNNEVSTMGRKQGSYTISHPDLIEQHVHQRIINDTNNHDSSSREYNVKHQISPEVREDSGVITDEGSSSSISSQQGRKSIPTHMTPDNTQDIYSNPNKRLSEVTSDGSSEYLPSDTHNQEISDTQSNNDDTLPPGWEKHEDNDGPYYWHIKSGTITRTPPECSNISNGSATQTTDVPPTEHPPVVMRQKKHHPEPDQMSGNVGGSVTRSNTSSALSELSDTRPRSTAVDNAYKRRSYPARSDFTSECSGGRPIRFAVRSLGWVEIAEEDLTPERSSKAVNRCIVDLSVGRRDVLDVVGCWGDGKDLFMDLDEGSLKLVDPENLTVLNTQPIHTIRVWGVGRDNGRERDFAYVARDRVSRKHMCHVFRCDTPARTIANTLRDICKKIMIERSLHQNINKPLDAGMTSSLGGSISLSNNNNTISNNNNNNNSSNSLGGRLTRPTNLPTEHRRIHRNSQLIPAQSFPTPMEEPKKVMRVEYVGMIQVDKPGGMEVINQAIEDVTASNPGPWKSVTVAVAPSTVTITSCDDGKQIAECRVRFLAFLGIGLNVKHCAFIMHNAQDKFVAYVFHCEPSTGALCKTIEAACKLRYQKCLDAHGGGAGRSMNGSSGSPRSISASLRSIFSTITGSRKARSAES